MVKLSSVAYTESLVMGVETSWHLGQGMKDVGNEGGQYAEVVETNLASSLESRP